MLPFVNIAGLPALGIAESAAGNYGLFDPFDSFDEEFVISNMVSPAIADQFFSKLGKMNPDFLPARLSPAFHPPKSI